MLTEAVRRLGKAIMAARHQKELDAALQRIEDEQPSQTGLATDTLKLNRRSADEMNLFVD